MANQYYLTEEFVREWNRIRSKVDSISGSNVRNERQRILVGAGQTPRSRRMPQPAVGGGGSIKQFKIITAPSGDMMAICHTWDGTNEGTETIAVRVVSHFAVDQVLLAAPCTGAGNVFWQEVTTNCLFPVALTKTGGSDGSKTTKCSFVYTVKDITGTITLGTGITPVQQADYNNAKRTGATKGMAYIDAAGTVQLFCLEDRTSGGC